MVLKGISTFIFNNFPVEISFVLSQATSTPLVSMTTDSNTNMFNLSSTSALERGDLYKPYLLVNHVFYKL